MDLQSQQNPTRYDNICWNRLGYTTSMISYHITHTHIYIYIYISVCAQKRAIPQSYKHFLEKVRLWSAGFWGNEIWATSFGELAMEGGPWCGDDPWNGWWTGDSHPSPLQWHPSSLPEPFRAWRLHRQTSTCLTWMMNLPGWATAESLHLLRGKIS